MPRLVDEVGVAGDGINLAVHGQELVVEIGQILQLRGAHEGEVGGIEKEHAPLAQHVRPGDGSEGVMLIALHGKIGNFFLDEGHGLDLLCIKYLLVNTNSC